MLSLEKEKITCYDTIEQKSAEIGTALHAGFFGGTNTIK